MKSKVVKGSLSDDGKMHTQTKTDQDLYDRSQLKRMGKLQAEQTDLNSVTAEFDNHEHNLMRLDNQPISEQPNESERSEPPGSIGDQHDVMSE